MPVINRIKEFLDSRGILPSHFSKQAGIAENTAYTLYKDPYKKPNSTVLDKICDTYRIEPSEILKWVPPEEFNKKGDRAKE